MGKHYLIGFESSVSSVPISPAIAYARPMRLLAPTTLLFLAACADQQVTYTGDLRPASGVCDPSARAQLIRRGHSMLFVPNSGTISLLGVQNGLAVTATKTLVGADKKPYKIAFTGAVHGQDIQGTYETPRCRYTVTLSPIGG